MPAQSLAQGNRFLALTRQAYWYRRPMRLIHVVAPLAVLALAGCGVMPVPTLTSTPTLSPSPTPTFSASPEPVAGDILFTLSATITSPVGATARVEQVVYAPVPDIDDEDAVVAQLDEECDGWRGRFTSPDYLVSAITVTDTSTGGKRWAPTGQVVVSMAGTAVYQGDYTPFQAYCASVQALVPATIRAVTPVPAGGSPDSAEGWGTITYGFGIATEAGTDVLDPRYTQISDCTVVVTPLARSLSTNAERWATSVIGQPNACELNPAGV